MSNDDKYKFITLQNITDWTLGTADEMVTSHIEADLKQSDSEVKEYFEWLSDAEEKFPRRSRLPTPRIVEREMNALFKASGGRQALMEQLYQAINGSTGPTSNRGRGR
jgi:hypothetical protein